jgi:hypothetical protein
MTSPLPNPPSEWSDDHFRDAAASPETAALGRGMVGHVPVVAALLIVQGGLELVFASFAALFGAFVVLFPSREAAELRGAALILGALAVPALLVGILRIVAGFANRRYRRRSLGLAAMMIGLGSVFTFYCAPTAIGIAVYGLVVYLNESVVVAFDLGQRGKSYSEIQAAFPDGR